MNKWILSLTVVAFGFAAGSASASEFNTQCAKFSAPLTGGYCVDTPKAHASGDFIYYLHGSGGNEHGFEDPWYYTHQLQAAWQAEGAALPTVISISFGPNWLLAQKNSSRESGLLEVFTQQLIPMIEKKLGGLHGRRIVFGESMGAFNTIQLALRTNLFSRAAIIDSPMADVSPYASAQEIEAYVEQSSAWHYYQSLHSTDTVLNAMKELVFFVHEFYPTVQDWSLANPLVLASAKRSSYPELYITDGFYDRFASYEANEKFVALLKSHGAHVEWHPEWGGHCTVDIPSLLKFLVE